MNIKIDILPKFMKNIYIRAAVGAGAIIATYLLIADGSSSLAEAGSGVAFTPVQGLATTGLYQYSRNPLYFGLTFFCGFSAAITFDSCWPIFIYCTIMFVYLDRVVIPAEESILKDYFGSTYTAYCESTPRWM